MENQEMEERWSTGVFDDNGQEIFQFDIVEIHIPWETKTSYISLVDMTANFGALVGAHPAHKAIGAGGAGGVRYLDDFVNKSKYVEGVEKVTCIVIGNHMQDDAWNKLCEQNKGFDKAEEVNYEDEIASITDANAIIPDPEKVGDCWNNKAEEKDGE